MPEPDSPLHPDVGVIALPIDAWSPYWTSRHQVLMRLARHFHVLWVNPAPEWRQALRRPKRLSPEVGVPGQPRAFTIHNSAPWLPTMYRPAALAMLLSRARLRAARAVLERRGCTRIVLYLWHPRHAMAMAQVPHDVSCYHIYDEYSHAEVEQSLDPREVRLIRSVDQLFVTSPLMFERKGVLNPHALWVPNGVEFEAFSQPVAEPADLAGIPHPRIGYAGFIKKQLDWPLLLELARRHTEWSFVFVGAERPHPEIAQLRAAMGALPNVRFLGDKSALQLANYPQHFDVCIMPYRIDGYTKYIYPLKLHEYLASGRPTVATRLPVLEGSQDVIALVEDLAGWEREVARALDPEAAAPERQAARQARAMNHDWNRLTGEIADAIVQRLSEARTRHGATTVRRSA